MNESTSELLAEANEVVREQLALAWREHIERIRDMLEAQWPERMKRVLEVVQGAETLVGQGASQSDGHIVLELTSGRKQVRLTGMLPPVHPDAAR